MRSTERSINPDVQGAQQNQLRKQSNKSVLGDYIYIILKEENKLIDFLSDKMTNKEYKSLENKAKKRMQLIYG